MLISVSYYVGNISDEKSFENLEELQNFINNFLEICTNDYEKLVITFYSGEEEKRVRQIEKKQKGVNMKRLIIENVIGNKFENPELLK